MFKRVAVLAAIIAVANASTRETRASQKAAESSEEAVVLTTKEAKSSLKEEVKEVKKDLKSAKDSIDKREAEFEMKATKAIGEMVEKGDAVLVEDPRAVSKGTTKKFMLYNEEMKNPVVSRRLAGSPTKSPSSGLHKPTWKPSSKPNERRNLAGSPTKSPSSGLHKPTWKPSSKPAEHRRLSHHQAREAADAAAHADDPKLTKKEGKKVVEKKADLVAEKKAEVKAAKDKGTKSGKGSDSKESTKAARELKSLKDKKLALKAFFDTYEPADAATSKQAVTPLAEDADAFSFSAKFGAKSATYASEKDEKAEKKSNKAIKASVLAEEERKAAKEAENKATIVKGESTKAETKKDTAAKAAAKATKATKATTKATKSGSNARSLSGSKNKGTAAVPVDEVTVAKALMTSANPAAEAAVPDGAVPHLMTASLLDQATAMLSAAGDRLESELAGASPADTSIGLAAKTEVNEDQQRHTIKNPLTPDTATATATTATTATAVTATATATAKAEKAAKAAKAAKVTDSTRGAWWDAKSPTEAPTEAVTGAPTAAPTAAQSVRASGGPTARPIEEVDVVPVVPVGPAVVPRSEVVPAAPAADSSSSGSSTGGATKKDKTADAAPQDKANKGDKAVGTDAGTTTGAAEKPKKVDTTAAAAGAESQAIPTHDGSNMLPISSDATAADSGSIETVVAHTTVTKVGQVDTGATAPAAQGAADATKSTDSSADKAQKKKHGDDAAVSADATEASVSTDAAAADTNGLSVESILAHTGGAA